MLGKGTSEIPSDEIFTKVSPKPCEGTSRVNLKVLHIIDIAVATRFHTDEYEGVLTE